MVELKKGTEIELLVENLSFGGKGLARVNNFVVFIEGTIPGQRVLVRITRKKSSYAEASGKSWYSIRRVSVLMCSES